MSFGENRVLKFERRTSAPKSNLKLFVLAVTALGISVFATVLFWPAISTGFGTVIAQAKEGIGETEGGFIQEAAIPTIYSNSNTFRCTVTSVYDGDGPIHCVEGASIRLSAIAAREMDGTCRPGHPCPAATALAAKHELQSIVLGHILSCEQTGTSYNRVVAICWTESGLEVNCAMVRSGKALRWDSYDRQRRICS